MSIPVFELCGHKVKDIAASKARHWLHTNPDISEMVEGEIASGINLGRCLLYMRIPYQVLADTMTATHAPTSRTINPWVEQDTAAALIDAGFSEFEPDQHTLMLTPRGHALLQKTYAKLLNRDLRHGANLLEFFGRAVHEAIEQTVSPTGDVNPPEARWDTVLSNALTKTQLAAPFGDIPEIMIRRLVRINPYTADKVFREAL